MKKTVFILSFATLIVAAGCNTGGRGFSSGKIKKDVDSASYTIGVVLGKNLRSGEVDSTFNLDLIYKGIYDELNSKKLAIPFDQNTSLMQVQRYVSDRNLVAGKKFLDEVAKKSGVKKTASGLMYEVIKEGSGEKPVESSIVKVHYKGTFADGTQFDNSMERGEPAVFPLNGVIKGWTEGLQLMTVGSKYKFYVPSALGYGEQGQPQGGIGPNKSLVFEVELLSIEKEMPKENAKPSNEDFQKMMEEAMRNKQAGGQ